MEKRKLFAKKSLYNRNVGPTKPVPYEQKLVYENPVKKQKYLNYTDPTKVVNVLTYIRTKHIYCDWLKN